MRKTAIVLALGTLLAGAVWVTSGGAEEIDATACQQECERERMACVESCGREGDPVECEAECDGRADDCTEGCRD